MRATYKPGTQLTVGSHRVTIERWLSEGGFAHVYVARCHPPPPSGERVCLKRVAVPTKALLNLLRAEVDAMQRLTGAQNVVQYIDSHAERNKDPTQQGYEVFVLMEFCSGGGLLDFMNTRLRDQLREHEVLKIMHDITLGLAGMHSLRPPLIHRDLKIENVLLTGDGDYKLCDFGSASPPLRPPKNPQELSILDDDIQHHTTAQYRSPEMLDLYKGFPIDEKSDIWALGVFLYKVCYYTTPFEQEGVPAILTASYVIPTKPDYSLRLKNMIRVLLQPNPTQRPTVFQVMSEVCSMIGVANPLDSRPAVPAHKTSRPLPVDPPAGDPSSERRRSSSSKSERTSGEYERVSREYSRSPSRSFKSPTITPDLPPQLEVPQSVPQNVPQYMDLPSPSPAASPAGSPIGSPLDTSFDAKYPPLDFEEFKEAPRDRNGWDKPKPKPPLPKREEDPRAMYGLNSAPSAATAVTTAAAAPITSAPAPVLPSSKPTMSSVPAPAPIHSHSHAPVPVPAPAPATTLPKIVTSPPDDGIARARAIQERARAQVEAAREAPERAKLKQILDGLEQRSSTIVLQNESQMDSSLDFLRTLNTNKIEERRPSSGHRPRASWLHRSNSHRRSREVKETDDSDSGPELPLITKPLEEVATPDSATAGARSPEPPGSAGSAGSAESPRHSLRSFKPTNSLQQRVHELVAGTNAQPPRNARGYGKYTDKDELGHSQSTPSLTDAPKKPAIVKRPKPILHAATGPKK